MLTNDDGGFHPREGEEHTGRTMLAIEALHESQRVHMEAVGLRRTVKRMRWVWGVLALLFAVASAGYALRDQVEHFASKQKVDELEARVSSADVERRQVMTHLDAQRESMKRLGDQLDRITDMLLHERGRARR